MAHHILLSTLLDGLENHDDFRVIWVGSHEYVPKELTKLTDYLEICYEIDQCRKHVESIRNDRTVLLVFTDFFDHMIEFNEYPQVHLIYALNKNQQHIEYDNETCPKLVRIFDDEPILINRLRQDILLTYRNDLPINISYLKPFNNDLSLTSSFKNKLLFHWNQLFIYYLVYEENLNMDQLKEEMIELCQREYKDNPVQLNYIEEFASKCTGDNVLQWYTKHTFAFELMNKAFRTRNIDFICKFRYFIILLYNKLKELSKEQRKQRLTTVYRVQKMKKNELNMLKTSKGSLVSTNTIMSTTSDLTVAEMFINPTAEANVIFEINIEDRDIDFVYPFADISHLSSFPEEKEVLFFSGAVFRIDDVREKNDLVWIIKLTLTIETTEHIVQVMNILEKQLGYTSQFGDIMKIADDLDLFNRYHKYLSNGTYSAMDIVKFFLYIDGDYLFNIYGNPEKLIDYYEKLLRNENFIDQTKTIVLNLLVGKNYFQLNRYDEAFFQYRIVFDLLDKQNRLLGDVHNHIGDVWREKNDLESALLCYKDALQIIRRCEPKDKSIPNICRKIADIYKKQNKHQDANRYKEQANDINEYYYNRSIAHPHETIIKHHREQLGIELDPDIVKYACKLYTTGMNLVRKGDFTDGLENLIQAEEFFKNYYSLYDHLVHKLAKLYDSAAYAYLCLNKRLKALVMWKKSIDIRKSFNIE